MFRSRLEAYVNPLIDVRISSVVESGNSSQMMYWLMLQKSMISQIVPFFFGIPKAGLVHSRFLYSSGLRRRRAPILHCLEKLSSTTSLSLTGIAYGLARFGTASGFKRILTGSPV